MSKFLSFAFLLSILILLGDCEKGPTIRNSVNKITNGDFEGESIEPWIIVPTENMKCELIIDEIDNKCLLLKNGTVKQTITGSYKPHGLILKGRILTRGNAKGRIDVSAFDNNPKYNDPYYGVRASGTKEQLVSRDKWSQFELSVEVFPQNDEVTEIVISLSSEDCESEDSNVLYDDIVLVLN